MKSHTTIRVGSRESRLALVQTGLVIDRIRSGHPELQFHVVPMATRGDRIIDQAIERVGGKSLFIKELETALLENRIDLAVHSLKDMPIEIPEGLRLAAFSSREDPRDILVTREGGDLASLPVGARIGTGSIRRELQLRQLRPDLRFGGLRGNVQTRLAKLDAGEFDALILAAAGLRRLGLADRCIVPLSIEMMIPAVGQGVLAVETRSEDNFPWLMDSVNNPETAACVEAERSFLAAIEGGCSSPCAAHARIIKSIITLNALLASADQTHHVTGSVQGQPENAAELGRQLAAELKLALGY